MSMYYHKAFFIVVVCCFQCQREKQFKLSSYKERETQGIHLRDCHVSNQKSVLN